MYSGFGLPDGGDMAVPVERSDYATRLFGASSEILGHGMPHMTPDQRREWLATLRAELTHYRTGTRRDR